ncbi:SPFH domain-containing protein [Aliivibrio fischeri]|uniref:SPFH domain-containing protein n=1 Tax=Aliivibrio fischeri TaxID=668 RepID=UPI0007C525D8|nr:SPFH domain-containing protein [Aliivibrio fischeri]
MSNSKFVKGENGFVVFLLGAVFMLIGFLLLFGFVGAHVDVSSSRHYQIIEYPFRWFGLIPCLIGGFCFFGLKIVNPNESLVLQFFGEKRGQFNQVGFFWLNPLLMTTKVSLKLETHQSETIKVNELGGSPLNVSAIFTWRTVDSEAVVYELEGGAQRYVESILNQELRECVKQYPYEEQDKGTTEQPEENDISHSDKKPLSLTQSTAEISDLLCESINMVVSKYGIKCESAKLDNLSYAPEIASIMMQRQQAKAMLSAKKEICTGSVEIVTDTIQELKAKEGFSMSDSDISSLAKNLTLLMATNTEATPVVNIDD